HATKAVTMPGQQLAPRLLFAPDGAVDQALQLHLTGFRRGFPRFVHGHHHNLSTATANRPGTGSRGFFPEFHGVSWGDFARPARAGPGRAPRSPHPREAPPMSGPATHLDRRSALKRLAAAGAGFAAPMIFRAHAGAAPSETVYHASFGTSGMARSDIDSIAA